MILTLIAILALAVLGVVLIRFADDRNSDFLGFVMFCVGGLSVVLTALLLFLYAFMVARWIGAEYKADIVNREYGTTYTQAEMFYAGEVIDVVRELDRKRYQVRIDKDTP